MDGFGEGGVRCGRGVVVVVVVGLGLGGGGEDVWGEEVEAEREVGGGEDGEGFDEDVGCGLVH